MSRTFAIKTFIYDAELAKWLNDLERQFTGLAINSMLSAVGTGFNFCCTVIVSYIDEAHP